MKTKILLSVIMSTVFLGVPSTFAQGGRQDWDTLRAFQANLDQGGFDVTTGAAAVWNPLEDFCAGRIPDAGWVNSGSYLILNVPKEVPRPGEKPNLIPRFKIRHDEAIVLIGRTPPPAKYFGFYTFIAARLYPDKEERTFVGTCRRGNVDRHGRRAAS